MDDVATVLPSPRADVHHPVGDADGVLVMLNDNDGVAQVPKSGQRLDQPVVVTLMQTDRRLVQDVENADQPGADLRCQPDTLCLSTG